MSIKAGWYPDPQDPKSLRWFDGESWTLHTTSVPTGASVAPETTASQHTAKQTSEVLWAIPLIIGSFLLSGGMLYFNSVAPSLIADQRLELYGIDQRLEVLRQEHVDFRSHLEELNRHREALK